MARNGTSTGKREGRAAKKGREGKVKPLPNKNPGYGLAAVLPSRVESVVGCVRW